jgi:hypothetical protein
MAVVPDRGSQRRRVGGDDRSGDQCDRLPVLRQGAAEGAELAFNGASVGGLIFTPLWAVAIGRFGFAATSVLMGMAALAVLCPVSVRYLQAEPDAVGAAKPSTLTSAALLRNRGFLTISAAFALGLFAQAGLFAHLVTRLAQARGADCAALA